MDNKCLLESQNIFFSFRLKKIRSTFVVFTAIRCGFKHSDNYRCAWAATHHYHWA